MNLNKETQGEQPGGKGKVSAVRSRKFKYGALATVITILFIVAVIVINMIASVLGDRYPLKVDLTQEQMFQMTQESIDFLQGVDKDVNITVLASESEFSSINTYYMQAATLIKQYAQYSNRITVDFVDTAQNPGILNKYDTTTEKLSAGSILVESGDRHVVVDTADLFNIEDSYIKSSKAEQAMTAAVLNVTSEDQVQISILVGYEEGDYTGFASLLKNNNYNVVEQNIVSDQEIDPNSQFAIIYAPTRDYTEEAIQKLNDFMSNNERYGKSVLLVGSSNQAKLPNIASFLEQWNIAMDGSLAAELNTNYLFQASYLYNFCDYGEEAYTEKLPNTKIPVAMPYSNRIEVLNTDMVKVLLQTSSDAVIRPATADKNWQPDTNKMEGPLPTAVISSKTKYDGTTELTGNVIVVGSEYALDKNFLSSTSFNNSAYFLNIFNKIADREDTITIESKEVDAKELGINQSQVNANGIIFMIILPILILVIGLVIWIRRRNR